MLTADDEKTFIPGKDFICHASVCGALKPRVSHYGPSPSYFLEEGVELVGDVQSWFWFSNCIQSNLIVDVVDALIGPFSSTKNLRLCRKSQHLFKLNLFEVHYSPSSSSVSGLHHLVIALVVLEPVPFSFVGTMWCYLVNQPAFPPVF